MSTPQSILIVGGHGKVALHLSRILSTAPYNARITSLIRDPSHKQDIIATGAQPRLLSLEDASVDEVKGAIEEVKADIVYFAAGAGGKGGEDRTKAVDYKGAVKVFDALEKVGGKKARLVLISAIDVREEGKVPAHYTEEDIKASKAGRAAIPVYFKYKLEADKNLVKRTAFKWTILRPGHLSDEKGTGKASIGRTHLSPSIAREDVAHALAYLSQREDAAGLAIDFVGGDTSIEEGLDKVIKRGESDFK